MSKAFMSELEDKTNKEAIWSWPADLPKPTGYSTFEFTRQDPVKNCQLDYRITYRPGLWSAHCLQRSWGRQGSVNPRYLDREFDDQLTALAALERCIARRLKRGYRIVGFEK